MVTDRKALFLPHTLFVRFHPGFTHKSGWSQDKKVSLSRDKSSRKNPGKNSSVPGKTVKKNFFPQKLQFIFLFCKCFSKIFYYLFKQMKDEDFLLYCERVAKSNSQSSMSKSWPFSSLSKILGLFRCSFCPGTVQRCLSWCPICPRTVQGCLSY